MVVSHRSGAPCKVLQEKKYRPKHVLTDKYQLKMRIEVIKIIGDKELDVTTQPQLESGAIYKIVLVRDDQLGFLLRAVDGNTLQELPPQDAGTFLHSGFDTKCAQKVGGIVNGQVKCNNNSFLTHVNYADKYCPERIEFMYQAPMPGISVIFQAVGVLDYYTEETYIQTKPYISALGSIPLECVPRQDTDIVYCEAQVESDKSLFFCETLDNYCRRSCCQYQLDKLKSVDHGPVRVPVNIQGPNAAAVNSAAQPKRPLENGADVKSSGIAIVEKFTQPKES